MRDTFLLLLLASGIMWAWSSNQVPSPSFNTVKGAQNEKPTHASSRQAWANGKSKRTTEPPAEIEGLPSIYQDQEERHDDASVDSLEPKPGYGAIKGVPIQAWVQNRSSIPQKDFTAYPTDENMRVFVQCHEMKKKGMEYVGDSGCKGLIANKGVSN